MEDACRLVSRFWGLIICATVDDAGIGDLLLSLLVFRMVDGSGFDALDARIGTRTVVPVHAER